LDNTNENTDKDSQINSNSQEKDGIDTVYLLSVIYKSRYFIIIFTFVISVASIIYVLVAQPMYESETKLYPVNKGEASPLQEIASTFGMANKIENSNLLEVIRSRIVAKEIIKKKYKTLEYKDSVNLIQYWKVEELFPEPEFALGWGVYLLSQVAVSREDKETGVITIKVRMPERQLAADIANNFATVVTEVLQSEQRMITVKTRQYIESRLEEAEKRLIDAEEEMIRFKEQNYQHNSPALRAEIVKVERKYTLMQSFVSMLSKQRELILLEEARDKPVVNILDTADISYKPVSPKKREVVITNTIIAFLFSSFFSFLMKKYYSRNKIEQLIRLIKDSN